MPPLMDLPPLHPGELARYARHLSIPGFGEAGQRRLKSSSVLLIGTGGLGSPAALYLAAAGVGRIGLMDDDQVDLSNLQRQILHGQSSVGRPKLESATERLRETNPHVVIEPHHGRLTPSNAREIISRYDLVVDGCDNFPTRFLTNDTCHFLGKPCVYGSIHRFEGQMTVFATHLGGPCYRCLLPMVPPPGSAPSCAEAGVLGVLPGVIGSLQAMEAIKLLAGIGTPPIGRLLCYDALRTSFRSLTLARDPSCRLCGTGEITSLSNPETTADTACAAPSGRAISAAELRDLLKNSAPLLIDVRQPAEHAVAAIPGSTLIPLDELPSRLAEIPHDQPVYVHCKSGMRSARAATLLAGKGIQAVNVTGGIDAWLAL
jgi:adenylyltransferase/sulfurtransferase